MEADSDSAFDVTASYTVAIVRFHTALDGVSFGSLCVPPSFAQHTMSHILRLTRLT